MHFRGTPPQGGRKASSTTCDRHVRLIDDYKPVEGVHGPRDNAQTPDKAKFGWRQLAARLRRAAQGHEDAAEVATALQLILQIERVPHRVG